MEKQFCKVGNTQWVIIKANNNHQGKQQSSNKNK
jgi:hypothetical protein